jgi:hypothetical protein
VFGEDSDDLGGSQHEDMTTISINYTTVALTVVMEDEMADWGRRFFMKLCW